jgi:hypothetical protein
VLLGFAASGCRQEAGGGADSASAPAADSAPAPAAVATERELPPAGGVAVTLDGRLVDLRANESPLSEVLEALARTAGFSLEVGESGIEDRRLTASIRAAPLFDVLAVVLRGVDFEVDVAFDPVSQQHRIARLRIRPDEESPGSLSTAGGEPFAAAFADLLDSADVDIVLAALDALQRAGDASAISEIEPLLDDVDPTVRTAAERAIDALEEEGHGAAPDGD